MRICIIGISIPPVLGGLEMHTWELARHLVKAGHFVELIAWHPPSYERLPRESTIDGVRIYRLQDVRYRYYWWPAFMLAKKLHSRTPFDVVHAHTAFPAGLGGALLSVWKKVPLVITSHGSLIRRPMNGMVMTLLRYLLVRFSFRRAGATVGASRELVQLSVKFGAESESAFYLANATDTDKFCPGIVGAPIRKLYEVRPEDVVVLFLGHFEIVKGVQYFLKAARKLVDKYPMVKFLLVGMGREEDNITSLVDSLGLRDRFIFAGAVDNDEVPAYIAASDLAVFPSLAEATSIACLEVMACGRPVVVSNVGGLPEIVEDEKTGLIVDFPAHVGSGQGDSGLPDGAISKLSDAMGMLIENPELREYLGRNAAAVAKSEFSWESYVTRIEAVYRQAMGGDSSGR